MPWPHVAHRCRVCLAWGRQSLCGDCLQRFAPERQRCPRCALPTPQGQPCGSCLHAPPPFAAAVAAVDYGFPWDRLLADFKFNGQPELAAPLAALMVRALIQAAPSPVQAVVPVPLSGTRLAERGYNQAWELARRLVPAQGAPAWPQGLQRLRDTPHQVGLGRAQRLRNLRDAFWVPPEAQAGLTGRHVALVDDVLTTGVTAAAATQTLLAAGAASVQVWVLARTPPPDAAAPT
ncbi:MAG: phosphoribosyl transferase [Burkholderiales bacterium PBB5]|nr:MAG: phosphoribosyl transferase [Burkholderiales bacterium PBB5]